MQYQLISVPLGLGSGDKGAADGPKALHRCDIKGKLQCTGLPDITVEEVSVRKRRQVTMGDPHVRYLDEIVRVSQEVAERVDDSLQHDRTPIVIGGDHSVNLGAFSGASQALAGQLGLIYIDAHPDMNTADTTPTGNIHGMHLAALMGFGTPELVHVYGNRVKLAKQNLLHVGASDCDLEELDLIKREKLQTFTLFDLLTHNLAPL
ncbi:MAG TPA: arginase family protein, partial [Ktedonobacteraceae bacterium]|nr:arginase family protein [Ktedonobacteraceae bacterium]